jgi:hypothetical protein
MIGDLWTKEEPAIMDRRYSSAVRHRHYNKKPTANSKRELAGVTD